MSLKQINLNGQVLPKTEAKISFQNRAFKYGDGLFETMRVLNGHIPFIDRHYQRLKGGLTLLQINIPYHFTIDFFKQQILSVTGQNQLARVRFSAFRTEGGLYLPVCNNLEYLIEASPFSSSQYQWHREGLTVDIYKEIPLTFNLLSPIKSINCLAYILAANYRIQQGWDEVLLINQHGRISEAGSSNIFVWDGKNLLTPGLKEACVAGIIRSVLLNESQHIGFKVQETEINIDQLKKAKAIFLSNSVQGLKWVKAFQEVSFEEQIAIQVGRQLTNSLNQLAGSYSR